VAAVATHLADTSCLARWRKVEVADVLAPMLESGLVGGCDMTDFEMLWSTQSANEFDRLVGWLRQLEHFPIEPVDWHRAREVQRELWHRGQMRAVGLLDLLVAAVAERHRVTVLHYDKDFDLIAAVTGQPTTWVVAPGSVP
jgi:predicted nucleic acid-binding protein